MSTRKIIRNGMRRRAELQGYRPSAFVHSMFEKFQINLLGGGKVGVKRRVINQAKGTHPKRTWRMRVQSMVEA